MIKMSADQGFGAGESTRVNTIRRGKHAYTTPVKTGRKPYGGDEMIDKKKTKRQTKLAARVADRLRERDVDPATVGTVEVRHKPSCRATGTCNCDFQLVFPDRDDAEDVNE